MRAISSRRPCRSRPGEKLASSHRPCDEVALRERAAHLLEQIPFALALHTLGDRELVIAREVTKLHEEFLRGPVSDLIRQVSERDIKGEVTIVVRGTAAAESRVSQELLLAEIKRLQREGMGVKQISELLGERHSLPKREVYRLALASKSLEQDS